MQLEEGLDTGPVYRCETVAIEESTTAADLRQRLSSRTRLLIEELSGGLGVPQAQRRAEVRGQDPQRMCTSTGRDRPWRSTAVAARWAGTPAQVAATNRHRRSGRCQRRASKRYRVIVSESPPREGATEGKAAMPFDAFPVVHASQKSRTWWNGSS